MNRASFRRQHWLIVTAIWLACAACGGNTDTSGSDATVTADSLVSSDVPAIDTGQEVWTPPTDLASPPKDLVPPPKDLSTPPVDTVTAPDSISSEETIVPPTPTPVNALYAVAPDVANCKEGQLSQAMKDSALERLNYIRALHGLKLLLYEPKDDVKVQQASLIIVANAKLTHTPAATYECYTTAGKDGSGQSNIYIMYGSQTIKSAYEFIDGWLIDDDVESLGHRRWILDPFLRYTAFGFVQGKPLVNAGWSSVIGSAMKVMGNTKNSDTGPIDFVAYPHGVYPQALFLKSWFLSFSAVIDRTSSWKNDGIDYSKATVQVTDPNGTALTVSSMIADDQGFGLPNSLQWKVAGLKNGVTYSVKISGVGTAAGSKTYSYTFKIQ